MSLEDEVKVFDGIFIRLKVTGAELVEELHEYLVENLRSSYYSQGLEYLKKQIDSHGAIHFNTHVIGPKDVVWVHIQFFRKDDAMLFRLKFGGIVE